MLVYSNELTVNWGDSDPFGLVYFPRMMSWFNDTEHNLFRMLGYPVNKMVDEDRTAFVMGEINFRFLGPAAYGDVVIATIRLKKIGNATLHWDCKAVQARDNSIITEGTAIRIYAEIQQDGNLKSKPIPEYFKKLLIDWGKDVVEGEQ